MWLPLDESKSFTNQVGKVIAEVVGISSSGMREVSLARITVPAGVRNVPERNGFTELVIPIQGTGRVRIDNAEYTVQPQGCCIVPPKARFIIENRGTEDFVYWSVCVPAFSPELSETVAE